MGLALRRIEGWNRRAAVLRVMFEEANRPLVWAVLSYSTRWGVEMPGVSVMSTAHGLDCF